MPPIEVPGVVAALLTLGLAGIALLALVEKLIPILPSHVVLLFLGMSAVSDGEDLILTILAATGGSTIGSLCWYALGRTLGAKRSDALVVRFGRYVFLNTSRYKRLTDAYRRNHFKVTLVGQIIPGVRLYLPLPAGVLRLSPSCFLAATLLGTLMWNTPLLALGYVLRGSSRDPASVGLLLIAGLVAAEVAMFLALRFGTCRAVNAPENSAYGQRHETCAPFSGMLPHHRHRIRNTLNALLLGKLQNVFNAASTAAVQVTSAARRSPDKTSAAETNIP